MPFSYEMWFQIIEFIKIVLTLSVLSTTSFMDLKTREVRDEIWIFYGSVGGVLTFLEFILGYLSITQILLSVVTGLILGLVLFYALGFGGADAKLVWMLGIVHILNPMPYLGYNQLTFMNPIFIITVLVNSIFISIIAIFYNILKNIRWILSGRKLFEGYEGNIFKRILLLLVAYRASRDQVIRDKFAISVENETMRGRVVKLIGHGKVDPREVDFNNINERIPHINKYETFWVEKPLPFLIFVTGGFITSLIFGDISLALVVALFKIFR